VVDRSYAAPEHFGELVRDDPAGTVPYDCCVGHRAIPAQ
jgi:hypothetical protein